jgi:phosphate transport system protein
MLLTLAAQVTNMRTHFTQELGRVRDNIRTMGTQVNQATARAVDALIKRDFQEAREVKRGDRTTDQLRYDVETECITLMATQQPVARDLRELAASALVAVELERCGDYAKGVAKAARRISRVNADINTYNLRQMDTLARDMLNRSVSAFVGVDSKVARQVIDDDNHLDQMYNELLALVTNDMTANAMHIEGGTWLLHAGHCLERLADRATNIAERVIFVETGTLPGDLNVHTADEARKL